MNKNPENKDDGEPHPTILEAVRIVAEKIADARVPLKAQIREALMKSLNCRKEVSACRRYVEGSMKLERRFPYLT